MNGRRHEFRDETEAVKKRTFGNGRVSGRRLVAPGPGRTAQPPGSRSAVGSPRHERSAAVPPAPPRRHRGGVRHRAVAIGQPGRDPIGQRRRVAPRRRRARRRPPTTRRSTGPSPRRSRRLRGLQATGQVEPSVIDRATLEANLTAEFDKDNPSGRHQPVGGDREGARPDPADGLAARPLRQAAGKPGHRLLRPEGQDALHRQPRRRPRPDRAPDVCPRVHPSAPGRALRPEQPRAGQAPHGLRPWARDPVPGRGRRGRASRPRG